MKVLIAGVTGYLGSHVAAHLATAGHTVEGTSRNPEDRPLPNGVARLHRWDTREPLPDDAIDGADAIVLLTGDSVNAKWTAEKKRSLYDSRVNAARNLVVGLRASSHKPSVVVGASATGYYGDRDDDQLIEESPPGDDFLAGLAADWEEAVNTAGKLGIRVVNTRTGHVVGEGSDFLEALIPVWKWGIGGRLGNGRQWVPWVHVDDFSAIVRFILETPSIGGPVNVVSPNSVRQAEFSKALGRALHRPAIAWAPAFFIRLLKGEMAGEVLTSKHVVPNVLNRTGYTFAYPDLLPALEEAVG